MSRTIVLLSTVAALLGGCTKNATSSPTGPVPDKAPTPTPGWTLSSPAIKEGAPMDKKFTCDGADLSPGLSWTMPPQGTQSLALIMDDPDAPSGTFTHWVLYDLAPDRATLPEGMAKTGEVQGLARQGKNDFHKLGYGGPCPPPGSPHHYRFKLLALSAKPTLDAGATKAALESAMSGHLLGQTVLTGLYQR